MLNTQQKRSNFEIYMYFKKIPSKTRLHIFFAVDTNRNLIKVWSHSDAREKNYIKITIKSWWKLIG